MGERLEKRAKQKKNRKRRVQECRCRGLEEGNIRLFFIFAYDAVKSRAEI